MAEERQEGVERPGAGTAPLLSTARRHTHAPPPSVPGPASADGKVCLSLLGTWHGGDESEKWRPGASNLFQVLLSLQVGGWGGGLCCVAGVMCAGRGGPANVWGCGQRLLQDPSPRCTLCPHIHLHFLPCLQSMVFISDPYFNEPAFEGMRGTAEGASSSLKYNADLWLSTIRYAMVDQLCRPRPGFEAAITAHFRALRWRIMKQCAAWVEQATALDELFQKRLRAAVAELHSLLAAL